MRTIWILLLIPFFVNAQIQLKDGGGTVKVNGETRHVGFKYKVGEKYPEINGTTVFGETISSKNLKDSILVFNCWFSTCTPCMFEIPGLVKLQEKYKNKEVAFWAVSSDDSSTIRKIVSKTSFNYKQLSYPRELLYQYYQPFGFPSSFIIKKGVIVFETSGGYSSEKAADEIYKKLDEELIKNL